MKRAAFGLVFVFALSMSTRASEGVVGNWMAAANEEDGDVPPMLMYLKAEDGAALTGAVIYSNMRFNLQNLAVTDTTISFDAVQETNDNAATMSCSGAASEETIDLSCQVPSGAVRRYVLKPNVG